MWCPAAPDDFDSFAFGEYRSISPISLRSHFISEQTNSVYPAGASRGRSVKRGLAVEEFGVFGRQILIFRRLIDLRGYFTAAVSVFVRG